MMIKDDKDFHASAFIVGPDETTVLIRDIRKPDALWKFPGGKKKQLKPFGKKMRGETPLEAVIRETHEETGLWLKKHLTKHIHTVSMGTYNKHYFLSQINSYRGLQSESFEYEETKVFEFEDLLWLSNFHPIYREQYLQVVRPILKAT